LVHIWILFVLAPLLFQQTQRTPNMPTKQTSISLQEKTTTNFKTKY